MTAMQKVPDERIHDGTLKTSREKLTFTLLAMHATIASQNTTQPMPANKIDNQKNKKKKKGSSRRRAA
jgi:hypothetical protein